jgi:hypothetical protein
MITKKPDPAPITPVVWELREMPEPQRFVVIAAMRDGMESCISLTPDQARNFAELLCEYAANIDARDVGRPLD